MNGFQEKLKETFNSLTLKLFNALEGEEKLTVSLSAETTHFLRFNKAKVRQDTKVQDGNITLTLSHHLKVMTFHIPFTGNLETDLPPSLKALKEARETLKELSEDPFFIEPKNHGALTSEYKGQLLDYELVPSALFKENQSLDMTGLYTSGMIIHANFNSLGQAHWFSTDSFSVDYSLYNEHKAAKDFYNGRTWNQKDFEEKVEQTKKQLHYLSRPIQKVKKGVYPVYLAPQAIAGFIKLWAWGIFSEQNCQQAHSPLVQVKSGKKSFSPLLTLQENFKDYGMHPRFNEYGEVAPELLTLIENGKLKTTLASPRTEKEFKIKTNTAFENLKSTEIKAGSLKEVDILSQLGTGLYISNVHYLNWSDHIGGRVTGMTRFACFWVEKGELVGPIENLRFDENIFHLFGDDLQAFTDFREIYPNLNTYLKRHLGGIIVPGALIREMNFVN